MDSDNKDPVMNSPEITRDLFNTDLLLQLASLRQLLIKKGVITAEELQKETDTVLQLAIASMKAQDKK